MRTLITTALVTLTTSVPAHAGFFGSEMQADWRFPDFDSTIETFNFIVNDEVEIPFRDIRNAEDLRINVFDQSILFEQKSTGNWGERDFNGFWFHDLNGTIPRITGVTFDHSSNVIGLEQADLGFDNDSVWANFSGLFAEGPYWVRLDVEFIPAPGALAFFAIAAFTTKRRRRKE